LYTVYNIERERNKSKKNTHFCWLSSHDFAYFRLVVLLDCHFLSLHGPRHSPYSTILPLDVRPDDSFYISKAGFLLGKMLGEDGCFFWTKPWVFEKNMTGNHDFPAWWSSYVLFVLLGSRLLFQGYPNTWILFTNISIYVHCFFRQVLTICNLSCFNSHFSSFSAAFQPFPLLESMWVGDPNF
jgi:hypothetical protein